MERRKAKNPIMQLMTDIAADIAADNGYWVKTERGIRIYTRESRNLSLNANGGDYDYWTDYIVQDGVIVAMTDWSASFDAREWNVYSETEYCALSKSGLIRLAELASKE